MWFKQEAFTQRKGFLFFSNWLVQYPGGLFGLQG